MIKEIGFYPILYSQSCCTRNYITLTWINCDCPGVSLVVEVAWEVRNSAGPVLPGKEQRGSMLEKVGPSFSSGQTVFESCLKTYSSVSPPGGVSFSH